VVVIVVSVAALVAIGWVVTGHIESLDKGSPQLSVVSAASPPEQEPAQAAPNDRAPTPEPTPARPKNLGGMTPQKLLGQLEKMHDQVTHFTANISYTRSFALAGENQGRTGQMALVQADRDGDGVKERRFYVIFTNLVIGDRVDNITKEYVFDGTWLVERDHSASPKLMIRRQIAPEGEAVDPLRVGEGPFPIPFGQKKDDILRDFDVSLVDTKDGIDAEGLQLFVEAAGPTYQLLLKPKPTALDRYDFEEARIWYVRGSLDPRMARIVELDGDTAVLQIAKITFNGEDFTVTNEKQFFDTTHPPDDTWDVVTEALDGGE